VPTVRSLMLTKMWIVRLNYLVSPDSSEHRHRTHYTRVWNLQFDGCTAAVTSESWLSLRWFS
jgi:hypothetical protein